MPGVLLASHGELSKGILSGIRMIYGDCPNVTALGLEETDEVDRWGEELERCILQYPAGAIVLVDLFGGTPCNQSLLKTIRRAKEGEKVSVVSGLNLGMAIEVLSARDMAAAFDELTKIALDAGRSAISDCLERFRPPSA